MTKETKRDGIDLSESSVYGPSSEDSQRFDGAEGANDAALDRLQAVSGEANDKAIAEGRDKTLAEQFDELDAETDEEIDALKVNLYQDDELSNARDGSGRIVDDLAEERLSELTETGPELDAAGALSVTPGLDDTSARLRDHEDRSAMAGSDSVEEGNLEEPRDEERESR